MSHHKQWTVFGLIHFLTQISKTHHIALHLLSFDSVSQEFEALPFNVHSNHIIHSLWEETLQTVDDDDMAPIQCELEQYLCIIYWMNRDAEYRINQEDILTLYRVFPFINDSIQNKLLQMIVTPDTLMTHLFSFLLDMVDAQKPRTALHLYDDFNRIWPTSCAPFIDYLLPAIIRYAVDCAQLDEEETHAVSIRWGMSDIIMEIADIIGQKEVYFILHELLTVDGRDWRYYEAILFCVATHSKVCGSNSAVAAKRRHPLYKIFVHVMRSKAVCISNKLVWDQAIHLLGHHCGLFGGNDCVLGEYFDRFIVSSLRDDAHDSQTKSFASNAFKRFGNEYRGQYIRSTYVQSMYNIYVHAVRNDGEDMQRKINIKQQISIIIGLTTLFTGFDDPNEIENAIRCLMQIPFQHLRNEEKKNKSSTQKSDDDDRLLVEMMKRISTIFKFFRVDCKHNCHLSLDTLLRMWPQICNLLRYHTENDDVMEYSVRCLKHVIRACPADYKRCGLFVPVLEQMIDLYCNVSQRSSFLYLLSIYLDEYHDVVTSFSASFDEICTATFETVSMETYAEENHEIIEDFYELVKVYMRADRPHVFEKNMHSMKRIFRMAIHGLLLKNANAHIAVTSFYQHFFQMHENHEKNKCFMDEIYCEYGRPLIHQILVGLQSSQIQLEARAKQVIEVMHHVYAYNKVRCQAWMQQEAAKMHHHHPQHDPKQMIHSWNTATCKRQRIRSALHWYSKCKEASSI
eukprot:214567_1